jgi:hypothetical protein
MGPLGLPRADGLRELDMFTDFDILRPVFGKLNIVLLELLLELLAIVLLLRGSVLLPAVFRLAFKKRFGCC